MSPSGPARKQRRQALIETKPSNSEGSQIDKLSSTVNLLNETRIVLGELERERVLTSPHLRQIADAMARGESKKFDKAVEDGLKDGITISQMFEAASIGIEDWGISLDLEGKSSLERER